MSEIAACSAIPAAAPVQLPLIPTILPKNPPAATKTLAGSLKYHGTPRKRRTDIALALFLAGGLHALLFLSDELFPTKRLSGSPSAPAVEVIQLEMPVLVEEPEVPDELEPLGEESAAPVMGPPQLAETPSVAVSLFTQPVQLAPLTVQIGQHTLRIPVGRPGTPEGKGFGRIFDLDAIDQPPIVRHRVPPDFPLELRRKEETGSVVVEFVVNRDGSVSSAAVVDSTHVAFEQPAVNAVSRWKFKPGKKSGRPVNTRVRQLITFNYVAD